MAGGWKGCNVDQVDLQASVIISLFSAPQSGSYPLPIAPCSRYWHSRTGSLPRTVVAFLHAQCDSPQPLSNQCEAFDECSQSDQTQRVFWFWMTMGQSRQFHYPPTLSVVRSHWCSRRAHNRCLVCHSWKGSATLHGLPPHHVFIDVHTAQHQFCGCLIKKWGYGLLSFFPCLQYLLTTI